MQEICNIPLHEVRKEYIGDIAVINARNIQIDKIEQAFEEIT